MSEIISALLTGADTAASRSFREEAREWRRQDLDWRQQQQERLEAKRLFTEEQRTWREQDLEQAALDNARRLWNRHVQQNTRDVQHHLEKLRTISELAALVAAFTVNSCYLNFQFELPSDALLVPFGLSMSLVALLEINSLLLCTLLLTAVVRIGKDFVNEEEEAEFMQRCHAFITNYKHGDPPPAPRRSFARHWSARCEATWRLAYFMFLAGMPLMVVSLCFAAFMKFDSYDWPSNVSVGSIISGVLGLALLHGLLRNRSWGWELLARDRSSSDWQAGSEFHRPCMGMPYDWHLTPSRTAHPLQPSEAL